MKRLFNFFICLTVLFSCPQIFLAEASNSFRTKYTTIHYGEAKDLDDFIWHLGGQRIELASNNELASNRVDRIVERATTILDMHPKDFKIDIYLKRGDLEPYKQAFYDYKTKSIYISVDHSSDSVLAHEIAHAVINQYFGVPPPSKIQEILTQYVDKYLWSDY